MGGNLPELWLDEALTRVEKRLREVKRWAQIAAIKAELAALREELSSAGFDSLEEELAGLNGLPSLTGGKMVDGYGVFFLDGRGEHAQRFATPEEAFRCAKRFGGRYTVTGPGKFNLGTTTGAKRFYDAMSASDRHRLDELCDLRGCRW